MKRSYVVYSVNLNDEYNTISKIANFPTIITQTDQLLIQLNFNQIVSGLCDHLKI